jgi:hypothetical protein
MEFSQPTTAEEQKKGVSISFFLTLEQIMHG